MFRPCLRLENLGLLTVFFLVTLTTHADTILVGSSLASPLTGPGLCPNDSDCSNRFSQFSTPHPFVIDDVKVAIGGGIFVTSGSFQVTIITNPGNSQTVVGNVGSGSLTFNPNLPPVTQIFNFSGLSIPLNAGVEYYLEVTGGDLSWDSDTPLSGTLGTLGLQLSCDPTVSQCGQGVASYDIFSGTYAEQISGNPGTVPEPSTWSLLAMGLFFLCSLLYFNSSASDPSDIFRRVRN